MIKLLLSLFLLLTSNAYADGMFNNGGVFNKGFSSAAADLRYLKLTGGMLTGGLELHYTNPLLTMTDSATDSQWSMNLTGGGAYQTFFDGVNPTDTLNWTKTLGFVFSSKISVPALSNLTSNGLIKTSGGNGTLSIASSGTDYEVPLTFSTGLTRTTNTVTVNASQSISTLSNLTTNGFVKTTGATGSLSVDTTTYLSSVTADTPLSGSGTSASHLVIANAASDGVTKGAATFNASNFSCSAGVCNTIQNIGTGASPTHAGITLTSLFSAASGKISFFGGGGIGQQAATTDLGTVLSNYSLRVAGTAYPITTSGAVNLSGTNTINGYATTTKAVSYLSYQPGLLTAVNSTIGVYAKVSNTSTVDNLIGSAVTFSCVANPTITMYECGTSVTCTSSPVTIGTVTVTAAGTAVVGTVSNPTITAGDYIGWAMTAGTCASIDISANAQVHSN